MAVEICTSQQILREKCMDQIYTVDRDLRYMIDYFYGKEATAKAQNGGERKCEVATANVIIISTETNNGRAVKERSRKKKTGGGLTFTSLLTACSKVGYNTTHYIIFSVMHCMSCCSLAWKIILIQKIWPRDGGIGGVARKREDLIIVDIDEASGDDETSCC
ncbi:hypothetical protein Dimus_033723 [Dionaea muscipula]